MVHEWSCLEKQLLIVRLYSGSGESIEPVWQKTLLTAHAVPHTEDDVGPLQQPSQVPCLADPSYWVQSALKFVKGLAREADAVWDLMSAQKKGLERTKRSPRHCGRMLGERRQVKLPKGATHPLSLEDLQCYNLGRRHSAAVQIPVAKDTINTWMTCRDVTEPHKYARKFAGRSLAGSLT